MLAVPAEIDRTGWLQALEGGLVRRERGPTVEVSDMAYPKAPKA